MHCAILVERGRNANPWQYPGLAKEIANDLATALARLSAPVTDEQMADAVRTGCTAADIHLCCSFPECTCKAIPKAARAALAAHRAGRGM